MLDLKKLKVMTIKPQLKALNKKAVRNIHGAYFFGKIKVKPIGFVK